MPRPADFIDKRSQKRFHAARDDRNRFYCAGCGDWHEHGGHRHHVVPLAKGGLSEQWNVLLICNSCHVTLHAGNADDRIALGWRIDCYMLGQFGMLFGFQHPAYRAVTRKTLASNPGTTWRSLNEGLKDHFFSLHMRTFARGAGDGLITWDSSRPVSIREFGPLLRSALADPDPVALLRMVAGDATRTA